jgi:hypothetical protein
LQSSPYSPIVGTDNGYLFRRTGIGQWQQVFAGSIGHQYADDILMSMLPAPNDPKRVFAYSYGNGYGLHSEDGGLSWHETPANFSDGPPPGWNWNVQQMFAVRNDGLVYDMVSRLNNRAILTTADGSQSWQTVRQWTTPRPGSYWAGDS